jgi:hypothetical protein
MVITAIAISGSGFLLFPDKNTIAATNHAIVPPAKPDQRIRRKCMARRSGQNGRIEKKGNVLYARFWLDVPGQPSRIYKCVRICPLSGPGAINKFEQN